MIATLGGRQPNAVTTFRALPADLMSGTENGLRERVAFHTEQIRSLQEDKASKETVQHLVEAVRELNETVDAMQKVMAARPLERAKEREVEEERRKLEKEAAVRERKLDRRWMVGTALAVTTMLISAMAILLPALGGGS